MYRLGINFDEISDNLDTAIRTMRSQEIRYGELRTVDKKNFVFWSDAEVRDFKAKVDLAGIELVAAATPLFKWYENVDDPEIAHDSFGFNPRITNEQKKNLISRTLDIASALHIPRLRIFSELGRSIDAGSNFAKSELLEYALNLANKNNIDLYLENEPVCNVHDKKEIASLFRSSQHPRLKLWLDIANLVEIGEDVDEQFLRTIASRLGYIHIKDYKIKNGKKRYLPAGDGDVPYLDIMKRIYEVKPDNITVTVETHAQRDKVRTSIASLIGTKKILKETGVKYE